MQPQRETVTDSLASIIQIIYLGYRSGTLTVERGEGKTLEVGTIVFSNGKVVEAKTGPYTGMPAFNILSSWQACRFSLVNNPQTPPQRLMPLPRHDGMQDGSLLAGTARQQLPLSPLHDDPSGGYYRQPFMPPAFPARLPSGEALLHHQDTTKLPRIHRRLLLLINGQRSVDELARLLVRSPEETQDLLNDLERSGLIQQ